ncbi:MAG: hypothetical protein HW415_407 [Deltaproteobacteria bacterium]|nr:hypothetical protein [Deltaproteobacteria bacterium]
MHRFYIEERLGVGVKAEIKGAEVRPGDQVVLFDGSGMEFEGRINGFSKDGVTVDITEGSEGDTESPVEIILGQGIPKSDKMDLIVQKSTELGVSKIVPIYSERVVPKSFSSNKIERWQRIAVEACKQSGRVKVPVISEPVSFDLFVKDAEPSSLKLIPWEGEKERCLKKILPVVLGNSKVIFIIGPEGGLTNSEIVIAKEYGFIPVSLGRRILRTETVPLALLSIVQYLYGDLG